VRRWTPRVAVEVGLVIAVGALIALLVAAAGAALPETVKRRELATPVVTDVIESFYEDPYVICTTRAQVTTCWEIEHP
jgi:hypothetical protein